MQVQSLENFKRNVQIRIVRSGISIQELADRIGWKRPYLSRILNTEMSPRFEACEKIAAALGVSLTTLIQDPKEKVSA